jgi:hypothetical protein
MVNGFFEPQEGSACRIRISSLHRDAGLSEIGVSLTG